jgi:hypothetical protein
MPNVNNVNMDAAADRFYKDLVKTAAPAPAVKQQKKSELTPQAPVVLPVVVPENPEAKFRKRYDDELDAIVEFEQYPQWFDESDAGMENAQRVLAWIQQHRNGYASRSTVAEGVDVLKSRGELVSLVSLRQPEPAPTKAPTPTLPIAVTAAAQPAPVAPPPVVEEPLPDVPSYVWQRIGKNPFLTLCDVKAIPSAVFSEIYRGPHKLAFVRRIDAIRAKIIKASR